MHVYRCSLFGKLLMCTVYIQLDWKPLIQKENGTKQDQMSRLMTKPNEIPCQPSEDTDQPGHPPSLIGVFAVRIKNAWILHYPLSAQWRPWSAWQADPSLRWAHMPFYRFCHEAAQLSLEYSWKSCENPWRTYIHRFKMSFKIVTYFKMNTSF